MDTIFIKVALILVSTQIAGMAARKLKMPEVLGALFAGIIIGPLGFHFIQYDSNIKLLSNFGVVLLMFLAGLKTDLTKFKKSGVAALIIAAAGIFISFILETLSAYVFYHDFLTDVFAGIILTATSVSITVETLEELGKLNTRSGIYILGASVIDDILELIIISVLLAAVRPTSLGASNNNSLILTFTRILFFCLIAVIAVVFLPNFIHKWSKKNKPDKLLFTLSIAAALFAGFFAEYCGLAAITGAYLCGLLLSESTHREYLVRNLKPVSTGFLSPIFFASVGIEVTLAGFNIKILLIAALIFLSAAAGKIIGCGGAARLLKMNMRESIQIGTGMVSRGEVSIITANIALQDKLISNEIFLFTLLVVSATMIVTPILIKIVYSYKKKVQQEDIRE